MSDYHGWGTPTSALSVMEHPTRRDRVVLMLTTEGVSTQVAVFKDEESAYAVQDWIDAAFHSSQLMNSAVLQQALDHGLIPSGS